MDARTVYATKLALATAAARLEAHSTQDWRTFVEALGRNAELAMAQMLEADPTKVHNAQGRAAALNELCNVLYDPKAAVAANQHFLTPPGQQNPASPRKPAP